MTSLRGDSGLGATADGAFDTVLVVDFGAQYAQLIARRVRECEVYSEIVPASITAAEIAVRQPVGVILSGGPASVHVAGAPSLDPEIYDLGVPVLGICYGAQLIAKQLGGSVGPNERGEYGRGRDDRGRRWGGAALGSALDPTGVDEPLRRHRRPAAGCDRHRGHRGLARGRLRGRRPRPVRRAVPSRGGAHAPRPPGAGALPSSGLRCRAELVDALDNRRPGRRGPGSGGRRPSHLRPFRAASTLPWPRPWCIGPSATGSPACWWTRACCVRARPTRWRRPSPGTSGSTLCVWTRPTSSSPPWPASPSPRPSAERWASSSSGPSSGPAAGFPTQGS